MVNIMDISSIFSMLLNNKNNTINNLNTQSFQQNNNQNIYPNCIPNNQKENIENNKVFGNNNDNNLLSTLLPLLMSGQNISMQEILKKMGAQNPMISTILKNIENKPNASKQSSKIDVSGLVKVKQE